MEWDKDLLSIQQTRDLIKKAKKAQLRYAQYDQEQVDKVCAGIVKKLLGCKEELARKAVLETGYGKVEDKIIKNHFAAATVWESIKDMKTRGIINKDQSQGIWEVGVAVGIIAGLIPSTNPTSTVIYKSLISLKSGNAIIFSPHPGAISCISATVELIKEALRESGAPEDLVAVLPTPTREATQELMAHEDVNFILATGGKAMVKAAYSSGTPAWGVGPGNVPAYIEKSADIQKAVTRIIESKTFDNGVICASEQAIVTEECIKDQVIGELKRQNCYFANEGEKKALEAIIALGNGSLNPKIVGKGACELAAMAGFSVPEETAIIIAFEKGVGKEFPFSIEKLTPLLAFYTEKDWESACETCIRLLNFGGIGHSLSIHTENMDILREFAIKKPVSRILVNTSSTHGGIGATTGISPALTLGCGAVGGSATSDNVSPLHLINIRKVAFGLQEYSQIKEAVLGGIENSQRAMPTNLEASKGGASGREGDCVNPEVIEDIVLKVLASLQSR